MLNAIQQGIFTASTKERLEELEDTKSNLEISILQNQIKQQNFAKEEILFWLYQFREMDIANTAQRQRLVDIFVNAVFIYDDRIVFTFNYKDGSKTVSLSDIQSSDLDRCSPPLFQVKKDAMRLKPHGIFFDLKNIKIRRITRVSEFMNCLDRNANGCGENSRKTAKFNELGINCNWLF